MSSPKEQNERYLLKLWLPVLAFVALVVVNIPNMNASSVGPLALVGAAVAGSVGFVVYRRRKVQAQVAAALKEPTVVAFRALVFAHVSPHYGLHMAHASLATVHALYGDVEEAERSLGAVSWDDCPPIVLAQRFTARAVISYVRGDYGQGRSYAIHAAEEGEAPSAAPGAKTSAIAFRTHVDLGRALEGRATETTVRDLEEAKTTLPILGRILAEWGLGAAAKSRGDHERLATARAYMVANAPHFTPITRSLQDDVE